MAGVDEPRPLITKKYLVKEVKRHFMQELTVDGPELIAKFLALKKEEREHLHRQNKTARLRPVRQARKTVDFTPSGSGLG